MNKHFLYQMIIDIRMWVSNKTIIHTSKIYLIANKIWNIAKWFWLTTFVAFLIGFAANLAVVQVTDLPKILLVKLLNWLFVPITNRIITIATLVLVVSTTVASGVLTTIEAYLNGGKVLRRYLQVIIEMNQGLNPKGFSQQSQAMISVNVPLEDIFIHLNAVSDRPVYDVPTIQEELLNSIRQRTDLSLQEREERIQRLRVVWYSQLGQKLAETWHKQNIAIEKVLEQLEAELAVAVLLGSPGSGKSTVLRWLSLHMARASLSLQYALPTGLTHKQIPILVRIGDYANYLSVKNCSFKDFFIEHFSNIHHDLPHKLLAELAKGHCLLLFDGLDEVASDNLRRQVTEALYTFIFDYCQKKPQGGQYNRFIITSRIVGYEPGLFNKYGHYTLIDLEDEQISQFLDNWCPAVERYQAMAVQGMKPLTPLQQEQATLAGTEQRERLLQALKKSPSVKRLAVNPLMLTILALIQRSGRTLPHRRVDLYQTVTRTLLDNWNQDSHRKIFTAEEVTLAEQLLGKFAYELHLNGPVLTEQEVKRITRQVMTEFYGKIKDTAIKDFIEVLRSSSGIFVESGQGLFSFMHRTFQEYFVTLHLLNLLPEDLEKFVKAHYSKPVWREPLLLTIAYKSGQSSGEERRHASGLIRTIATAGDDYDGILQRHILFAANSVVDCGAWSIDKDLQYQIANNLFDIYGDALNSGRYRQLQYEIEDVALHWLRGQPDGNSQKSFWSPFLEVWRTALCNAKLSIRQEGAIHLLSAISPDLASCPPNIKDAFIPLIIHLAKLEDLPCPQDVTNLLKETVAVPSSSRVEEYAYIALRMLDAYGPAGWFHTYWSKWVRTQPELLKLLTQHSLELGYLLSPVALPANNINHNWKKQQKISANMQGLITIEVQSKLLSVSNTAKYPHAYLIKQALDAELATATKLLTKQDWRNTWDKCLQREIMFGRSATYQTCRSLQLLLYKGNNFYRNQIVKELMKDLSTSDRKQVQALNLITSIYLHYLLDQLDPKDLRKMQELQGLLEPLELHYLLDMRDMLDIRYIEDMLDLKDLREPLYLIYLQKLLDRKYLSQIRYLSDLRLLINRDYLIDILCSILTKPISSATSSALIALYSVIMIDVTFSIHLKPNIENSLKYLLQQKSSLLREHYVLIRSIMHIFEPSINSSRSNNQINISPDNFAEILYKLRQERQISVKQVQWILAACNDTTKLSKNKQSQLGADTVQQVAWHLIQQGFLVQEEALPLIIKTLDQEAIICAAGALMLQSNKKLPQSVLKEASDKIAHILSDDRLSRRLLDPPDYTKNWRLDNLLFETLKILAE